MRKLIVVIILLLSGLEWRCSHHGKEPAFSLKAIEEMNVPPAVAVCRDTLPAWKVVSASEIGGVRVQVSMHKPGELDATCTTQFGKVIDIFLPKVKPTRRTR